MLRLPPPDDAVQHDAAGGYGAEFGLGVQVCLCVQEDVRFG